MSRGSLSSIEKTDLYGDKLREGVIYTTERHIGRRGTETDAEPGACFPASLQFILRRYQKHIEFMSSNLFADGFISPSRLDPVSPFEFCPGMVCRRLHTPTPSTRAEPGSLPAVILGTMAGAARVRQASSQGGTDGMLSVISEMIEDMPNV
ncbi:hypothetical protein EVG20_g6667 [Dentipellis fragilis]|uniref:Uncharacterized protein n=1 Tax=Dentipellis fragilis TaxID=205917 RepID=A0A4Y9YL78_9AGAM|nr:hypothetical protein EVG20_g6667 [Dentipellis fragilis]